MQRPPVNARTVPVRRVLSSRRVLIARLLAIAVDIVQFALLPLVTLGAVSPADDIIDVATAIALTWLIGWHWSFLPAFIAEIVPFVDLVPSWTLAVFIATRGRRDDVSRS